MTEPRTLTDAEIAQVSGGSAEEIHVLGPFLKITGSVEQGNSGGVINVGVHTSNGGVNK